MSVDLMVVLATAVSLGFIWIGLFTLTRPEPEKSEAEKARDEPVDEEEIRRIYEFAKRCRRERLGGR